MQISQSGSGQMLPLPMNELIQQQLKAVGIEVEFDVLVWETLFNNWRVGAKDPKSNGAHAINVILRHAGPVLRLRAASTTAAWWRRAR